MSFSLKLTTIIRKEQEMVPKSSLTTKTSEQGQKKCGMGGVWPTGFGKPSNQKARVSGDAHVQWFAAEGEIRNMKMEQKMSVMVSLASLLRKLCCLLVMPGFIGATALTKVKQPDGNPVRIDSAKANNFLANLRPKRNVDPKWYRGDPDFQSYYSFYNSIGHIEGLYEIDRIRMLYQQMRHLELTYGPDAASYLNKMGETTSTAGPATTTPPPTPPTTPAPTPDPLEKAEKIYLCNPKDPLCKPRIVYLPTGAVPILCDPRLNLACGATKEEGVRNIAPSQPTPATPTSGKAISPVPPPVTKKGMEYDCDPYWDPDCLIDQPAQEASSPVASDEETTDEGNVPVVLNGAKKKGAGPYFDPYDFKSDLYDPYRYAEPAPDPQ